MRDEARRTDRHHDFGRKASSLRGNPISFVSAGRLTNDESTVQPVEQAIALEATQLDERQTKSHHESEKSDFGPDLSTGVTIPSRERQPNDVDEESSESVLDTGLVSSNLGHSRQDSNTSRTSDELIFSGRKNHPPLGEAPEKDVGFKEKPISVANPVPDQVTTVQVPAPTKNLVSSAASPLPSRRTRKSRHRLTKKAFEPRPAFDSEEDAIMQDYINNLAMSDDSEEQMEEQVEKPKPKSWKRTEHHRNNHGSGKDNMKVQVKVFQDVPNEDSADQWESADLEDFDVISTTDEEVEEVSQILRQRMRPSGLQYLVKATGVATSEAKWVVREKIVSLSGVEEIDRFEAREQLRREAETVNDDESGDEDSNEEGLNDLLNELDSEEDENARILEHTARMTDEEIAKALAKQEELGMGSHELLLFNGLDGAEGQYGSDLPLHTSFNRRTAPRDKKKNKQQERVPSMEEAFAAVLDHDPYDDTTQARFQQSSNRSSGKGKGRSGSFPSAAAFADVLDQDPYGGFDIMDFERPSLRPRKKGRKGDLPSELVPDDPELAEQLRSSWEKDRLKKASRKIEKMEAKAAAATNGDPESIKNAIRRFLMTRSQQDLSFPPMSQDVRKQLHRLAHPLVLNSKSRGKDDGRFTVFTKTAHTPAYDAESIWEIDALLNQRRFFGNSIFKSGRVKSLAMTLRSRANNHGTAGATYMEGEVVGRSAPEIAADNKGRAMLEKMGWSSGQGIGAVGNEGKLDVVQTVIKYTKAGLG